MSTSRQPHKQVPGPQSNQVLALAAKVLSKAAQPRLRLCDDPYLAAAVAQLHVNPEDPELAQLLWEQLQQREAEYASADPFLENDPAPGSLPASPGELTLLNLRSGQPLTLAPQILTRNLMITGPSGSGKSCLTRHLAAQLPGLGCVVVYFDRKHEARQLLGDPRLANAAAVLSLSDLCISLYQPMPGAQQRITNAWTTSLIATATGRVFAQRLMEESVDRLFPTLPPGEGIPLLRLIAEMEQHPPRAWRQRDLFEGMLLALRHLQTYLGGILGYCRSDCIEQLFRTPRLIVLEMPSLEAELSSFCIAYLMRWLFERRVNAVPPHHPPVIFVLDDATAILDSRMDQQAISGTSPLVEQVFMGRSLGMGVIIDVHAPSQISPKLIKNMETVLCTCARGEDPRFSQNLLGITPDQAAYLRVMPVGQVVAFAPSRHPLALLGSFPPPVAVSVSDADCHLSALAFLRQVTSKVWTPPTSPSPSASPAPSAATSSTTSASTSTSTPATPPVRLGSDDLRILVYLSEPLPPTLTTLYARMALGRTEGARRINLLAQRALLRIHRFPTGRRGGALSIGELTDDAWRLLAANSLATRPKPLTHGGFAHNLAAQALRQLGQRQGVRVAFEVDMGAVRIDASYQKADGTCEFFQIGVTDPQREAQAIVKAMKVPLVAQSPLILVCIDKAFAQKTLTLVRQAGVSTTQISYRLVGELIEAATGSAAP